MGSTIKDHCEPCKEVNPEESIHRGRLRKDVSDTDRQLLDHRLTYRKSRA
jgi:hypothetical protein